MKREDLAAMLRNRSLPRLLRATPQREHAEIRRWLKQESDEDVISAYTTCHVCGESPPDEAVAHAIELASDDDHFLFLLRQMNFH